jgi:hypothetical protein
MAHDVKLKRLLNFHKIIQARSVNKSMDIESIKKKLKISCPICMDETKLEIQFFMVTFFVKNLFMAGLMHKISVLFVFKKLI